MGLPPETLCGANCRSVMIAGLTVTVAVCVMPLTVAVTVTVVAELTELPVNVKVALVWPAGIVTVPGTVPAAPLEVRVMTYPPVGAGDAMVTVPVDVPSVADPPMTEFGLKDRAVKTGGVMVRLAAAVLAPLPAVIGTTTWAATATVVTVNVAVVWPAATVTVVGTVADAFPEPDWSGTTSPAAGAAELIVRVAVLLTPPSTVVGFSVRLDGTGAVTLRVALAVAVPAVPVMVTATLAATATVFAVKVAEN